MFLNELSFQIKNLKASIKRIPEVNQINIKETQMTQSQDPCKHVFLTPRFQHLPRDTGIESGTLHTLLGKHPPGKPRSQNSRLFLLLEEHRLEKL